LPGFLNEQDPLHPSRSKGSWETSKPHMLTTKHTSEKKKFVFVFSGINIKPVLCDVLLPSIAPN
jgi:hypothetical protein